MILKTIIIEALGNVDYFVKRNLRSFANVCEFVLPYLMFWVGVNSTTLLDWALLIPLIVFLFVYFTKSAADKLGTGNKVPVPTKRFTTVDEFGEVSIENDRVQEVILYLADLEDWMERKNLI